MKTFKMKLRDTDGDEIIIIDEAETILDLLDKYKKNHWEIEKAVSIFEVEE